MHSPFSADDRLDDDHRPRPRCFSFLPTRPDSLPTILPAIHHFPHRAKEPRRNHRATTRPGGVTPQRIDSPIFPRGPHVGFVFLNRRGPAQSPSRGMRHGQSGGRTRRRTAPLALVAAGCKLQVISASHSGLSPRARHVCGVGRGPSSLAETTRSYALLLQAAPRRCAVECHYDNGPHYRKARLVSFQWRSLGIEELDAGRSGVVVGNRACEGCLRSYAARSSMRLQNFPG